MIITCFATVIVGKLVNLPTAAQVTSLLATNHKNQPQIPPHLQISKQNEACVFVDIRVRAHMCVINQ